MSASERVLLRAHSGAQVGVGHMMRTRAVAEEIVARGGEAWIVVDDEASAAQLRDAGFDARTALEQRTWQDARARGAWLDGFVDWSEELCALARARVPSYLVENRTPAREHAGFVVHPSLHVDPDAWERAHAMRVLRGPEWIPLGAAVRAQAPAEQRDIELLVTFGGSDPLRSTERVLALLPSGLRVAVSVGLHMEARRAALERAARHLRADVLAVGTPLAPWMARARLALTALGTTLYELAHLRTPALVLANHDEDRLMLDFYRAHGPFHPLGLARELDDRALGRALAEALATRRAPAPAVPGLGAGAARLAERLLARSATRVAP